MSIVASLSPASENISHPYQVLARKYRPRVLKDLIGQEILVKTLTNGLLAKRLPPAFLLTGIRGVGKTTTARILACAFNCCGIDGTEVNPRPDPCGECSACLSIIDEKCIDVIELDAASHTSIEDIKPLIEGARYKALQVRHKVFIVDEVHMLSKSAFNALLKTLEEPPPHVTFIFATTELYKVPDTIVSRCMRFDLQRITRSQIAGYLSGIADKERITLAPEAADVIAYAADGSMRDALSLLDQAVTASQGNVSAEGARQMLGLADRHSIRELGESLFKGEIALTLGCLEKLYQSGAEPLAIIDDLLTLVHDVTHLKITETTHSSFLVDSEAYAWGKTQADLLSIPVLTRLWQLLLKGYQEVKEAPHPLTAARMVCIRAAYVKDLPTLFELESGEPLNRSNEELSKLSEVSNSLPITPESLQIPKNKTVDVSTNKEVLSAAKEKTINSLNELLILVENQKEAILHSHLVNDVRVVSCCQRKLVVGLEPTAPKDFVLQMHRVLKEAGEPLWEIQVVENTEASTYAEQLQQAQRLRLEEANQNPLVKALKQAFPGAEVH